jgi:uncharacterized membrane protein
MRPEADQIAELKAEVGRLSAQVENLERRLSALEKGAGGAALESAPETTSERTKIPRNAEVLESRLGVTFVNRAGAITLAIGIVFFFKYAVDNSWIGAAGRVALGIITGSALIVGAEWLRNKAQQAFAQGVACCGIAILYTALYASFVYYALVPEWVAFCGMLAVCALAVGLTFRYEGPALAALGVAGAFVAPLLLGHAMQHPWLLFSYLLLLDAWAAGLCFRRHWVVLYAISQLATAALFLAWTFGSNAALHRGAGVLFLCALFGLLHASGRIEAGYRAAIPFHAAWTMLAAWMLLDAKHPGWFALFALGLCAVHFSAASATRMGARRDSLYVVAHGCLLSACVRVAAIWATNESSPVTRASVISESTSVLLAIYAIAAIAVGLLRRSALDRIVGLGLLGAVIGKLYFYDVWQLTRVFRISAFVALGILLLGASYIYSRYRYKLEAIWAGREAGPRAG